MKKSIVDLEKDVYQEFNDNSHFGKIMVKSVIFSCWLKFFKSRFKWQTIQVP
jgi:hypothetical protein